MTCRFGMIQIPAIRQRLLVNDFASQELMTNFNRSSLYFVSSLLQVIRQNTSCGAMQDSPRLATDFHYVARSVVFRSSTSLIPAWGSFHRKLHPQLSPYNRRRCSTGQDQKASERSYRVQCRFVDRRCVTSQIGECGRRRIIGWVSLIAVFGAAWDI